MTNLGFIDNGFVLKQTGAEQQTCTESTQHWGYNEQPQLADGRDIGGEECRPDRASRIHGYARDLNADKVDHDESDTNRKTQP